MEKTYQIVVIDTSNINRKSKVQVRDMGKLEERLSF